MEKKDPNEVSWSPENTFVIVFLVILIPLLLTGFFAH